MCVLLCLSCFSEQRNTYILRTGLVTCHKMVVEKNAVYCLRDLSFVMGFNLEITKQSYVDKKC